MMTRKVALIGDFHASVVAHQAIPRALELSSNGKVHGTWVVTASIQNVANDLEDLMQCGVFQPARIKTCLESLMQFNGHELIAFPF